MFDSFINIYIYISQHFFYIYYQGSNLTSIWCYEPLSNLFEQQQGLNLPGKDIQTKDKQTEGQKIVPTNQLSKYCCIFATDQQFDQQSQIG